MLSMSGLGAFFVGVSHQDEAPVARVAEPALATGSPEVAEAPAEEPVIEEEVTEEVVEEESQEPAEEPVVEEESAGSSASGLDGITPPPSEALNLTYPNAGIQGDAISNTDDPAALHQGAIKLPSTGFPWEEGSNTYIAGHVVGYAGTGSYMQFAELPNAQNGDEFYLTDAAGNTYTYQVFDQMTVSPTDVWVTQPVDGRNIVSLQTCVGPSWEHRLVIQGELVSVDPA